MHHNLVLGNPANGEDADSNDDHNQDQHLEPRESGGRGRLKLGCSYRVGFF